MILTGQTKVIGDHIDTDLIIAARYLNISDPKHLAAYCFEDYDPTFAKSLNKNTILVAGENFGCGSSREHAPIALKEAGFIAVVAKSFARIFYRNAINIGLPVIVHDAIIENDVILHIDLEKGQLIMAHDHIYPITPYPDFLKTIISSGGLMATLKEDSK